MMTILYLDFNFIFAISFWKKEIVNTFRVDINIIDVCLKSQKLNQHLSEFERKLSHSTFLRSMRLICQRSSLNSWIVLLDQYSPYSTFTSYIVKDHPRDECEGRIEAVGRDPEVMKQRGSLVRVRAPGDRLRGCRRYSKFLQTGILGADDSRTHDAADQGDVLPGVRNLIRGITRWYFITHGWPDSRCRPEPCCCSILSHHADK